MEESNIETHNAILTECQTLREHESLGNRSMTCHLDLATSLHTLSPCEPDLFGFHSFIVFHSNKMFIL